MLFGFDKGKGRESDQETEKVEEMRKMVQVRSVKWNVVAVTFVYMYIHVHVHVYTYVCVQCTHK